MSTLHLSWNAPKPGGEPFAPTARIRLKFWSENEHGVPLLTCQCVSIEELEYETARIKRELDAIVKQARRRYAKHAKGGA